MPQRSGPTTVYRLFSCDGALLYVGIAGNPGRRFEQHAEDKPWWSAVATIRLEHYDTREEARGAELRAISAELPAHNKAGVDPNRHAVRLWPGTAARFADCCERCRDTAADAQVAYAPHPVQRAWAEGGGLTAAYTCSTCGHTWTCWWGWQAAA